MKLCLVLLLILITSIPSKEGDILFKNSDIEITSNKIQDKSIYLFGEPIKFNVNLPSHPNFRGLPNKWTNTNAWDIFVDDSMPVYSLTNGIVLKSLFLENGKTVWGYNITISTYNNTLFYTHLDTVLFKKGDTVKKGDLIGYIGKWPSKYKSRGKPMPSHLHIAVQKGHINNYIGRYSEIKEQKISTTELLRYEYLSSNNKGYETYAGH